MTAPIPRRIAKIMLMMSLLLAGCATSSDKSYLTLGNQYARDGLLREAADSYKKALSAQPENAAAHRNLGMVLVKLGDYKSASKHLEKSIKRYEQDFDANLYLGESYRAQDKFADAIFRYKRSLQIRPDDLRAMKPLAWSYFKIRYYTEALAVAQGMQKLGKKDDQIAIITSRTLLMLKRSREALATIQAAKKTVGAASRPYYASVEGDILLELGRKDDATKSYRAALKEQPLLGGALLGLGKCLLQSGDSKQAISYMERAIHVLPKLTEAYFLLGTAYEAQDKEKSMRYYQAFLRRAAFDPEYLGYIKDVKHKMAALQPGNAKSKPRTSSKDSSSGN